MRETEGHVLRLWAKTDRADPERWHPLVNHLVDVGAVAHVMWETVIPSAARHAWSQWFGNEDGAGAWLALLAGLHDLGKASPVFQAASATQRERLVASGLRDLRPLPPHPIRHGTITAAVLPALLREQWPHLTPSTARRYGVVAGMHHGSVFDNVTLWAASPRRNPDQIGTGVWEAVRRELFQFLLDAVPGVSAPPETPPPYALATWAAGLISVADWIGSNVTYFPFATPVTDAAAAMTAARLCAQTALDDLGWRSGMADVPLAFDRTFPGWQPNTTQQATIDAVRAMDGPGLIIVEAPMGTGKTEAAFWTAGWAARHWGTRGLYVAMPTRSSSDQLFSRLRDHLVAHAADDRAINLQLLHGHAAISAQMEQVRRRDGGFDPESTAPSPDQPVDAIVRADWFAARRRGLLAPYGVGTVDQTLLGILENRHYFVRLHGLTGKTLVFDEVHAYDTYMETLFAGELEALGALGTPVVILTATLPRERREALARAYVTGANWPATPAADPAPYPRVTTVDRQRVATTAIAASERRHAIALRWFLGAEIDARERLLHALVETLTGNHGTCAVICNTVAQAQEMFDRLDSSFPGEVILFHARFRYVDRADRQERVLGAFGKHRRLAGQRIVVATQVIEQSLDLDFDLMVSYFCPTDLLIQRVGRMHRHASNDPERPSGLARPQLWVLGVGDPDQADTPALGVPYSTRLVYEPHILLRSWATLRQRDAITLPGDIEPLIEATYGTGISPPSDLADAWRQTAEALRATVDEETRAAEQLLIPSLAALQNPDGSDPLIRNVAEKLAEDEQTQDMHVSAVARTRHGPPSIDVVLLTVAEQDWLAPPADGAAEAVPLTRVAELLARSVSLSRPGLVRALLARDPPPAWTRTSWLRRHRLVCLDDTGMAPVGTDTIELSPALGIVIHPGGPPEEEQANDPAKIQSRR